MARISTSATPATASITGRAWSSLPRLTSRSTAVDTLLSGLLGVLQGGDGAAEQEQGAGHVAPGRLEAALVAAAGLGEQRSHVLAEHGEGRVREPGLEVGHPGHQQGRPAQGLDMGEVLGGHDAALLHQACEPGRVDPCGPLPGDADAAHPVQPVEQRHHVARRGRFRGVPQPGEPGAPDGRVGHEQAVERGLLGLGHLVGQDLKRPLSRPRPGGEADPFQHRGVRHQHAAGVKMGQHGMHDRLAAVGGPGGIGTHPQAIAPVAQPEAAQPRRAWSSTACSRRVWSRRA